MLRDYINKIYKGTTLVLGLNAINYLCSFILAVLVSRFLGIETFGEYNFIFAFVLLIGVASDFGLSTLLIRKMNENKFEAKMIISRFNLIKIILSLSLILVLYLTVFLFFKKFFSTALLIGILLIMPRTLISTYESSLRSLLNQSYPVIIRSINSILQLTVSYFLLLNGSGIVSIFLCILIFDTAALLIFIAVNNYVLMNYFSVNKIHFSELDTQFAGIKAMSAMKESSVFFVNNFFMLSMKGLNVILLGYLSTSASVGIYSAGSRIVSGVGLFSGALFNSFFPVISSIKDNLKIKVDLTKKFVFCSSILGLMLTTLLFFLSETLINLTFKTGDSVIVLKILSFSILPVLVYTVTQSFLFSVYGEKFLTKVLITAWSLNIFISIILIIQYDYAGCAAALTVTEIFLMIVQLSKFNNDTNSLEIQKATLSS